MAESDGRIEELVREHGRMLVRLAASRPSSVADVTVSSSPTRLLCRLMKHGWLLSSNK